MIDSGATGTAFVDSSFVQDNNLKINLLPQPLRLRVVDGRPSSAGDITTTTTFALDIKGHTETLTAFVTKLHNYNIILGKPWLRKHNPSNIDWDSNVLSFNSNFCKTHCLLQGCHQIAVSGLKFTPKPADKSLSPSVASGPLPRRLGAAAFHTVAKQPGVDVFSASLHEINSRLETEFQVDLASLDSSPSTIPRPEVHQRRTRFEHGVNQMELDLNALSEEDSPSKQRKLAADVYCAGASLEDIQIALQNKPKIDPRTKLPGYLHDYLPAFDTDEADKLPPHRSCDHTIELKPGETPPHGPLYNMSEDELKVLRKFLQDNLAKGFIRASNSPAASPVLFAKKPGGGLRFCVDYRALNAITIKNRYPLPLIQETLARLSKAKFYTKLDIIAAFNRIRMADGQEWMTAFNTRYGLFESLVMPFGLSNAPATFQARINEVLRPFLDIFCTAYIDDILVYSDNLKDHRNHVKAVLQALIDAGLQLDIKKCEFEVQEVTYLGLIISTTGVRMNPSKVECITNWEPCSNVKDVQAFLGFANFYRRFIKNFSRIVSPLVQLTKKAHVWDWSARCTASFKALKAAFTSAPTLRHFDPEREVWVETDASDYVSSGILSQKDDQGILHPVAFMSKKYDPAECNYEIYDKELLAIVRSFETWRSELQGSAFPIRVLTDHRNLEYFMTTKQLTRRQVRWSEFLSQFDFVIRFRPGKDGGKPDALTRRSQDLPQSLDDIRTQYRNQSLLKPENIDSAITPQLPVANDLPLEFRPGTTTLSHSSSVLEETADLNFATLDFNSELQVSPATLQHEDEPLNLKITRLLEEGYGNDEFYRRTRDEMYKPQGIPHSKEIPLSECRISDGRLFFRDRLYIPDTELRPLLIKLAHDSVETGHPGKNKLYEILSRDYFWPRISYDAAQYCRNCHDCIRNKGSKLRYQGTLKPLPLPVQRWRDISVDFVGPLVKHAHTKNNCIMVVVDRLSKDRHYIPCNTKMKASELARLFCRDVWKLHGLPDSIVSDRGSLFVSEFWKAVCHRLRINISLSTAYHPETDGNTEIANAYMEQYLRQFVDYTQKDWEDLLPMAEFAARNAVSSSTGVTPFFANHGHHPRMSFGPPRPLYKGASRTVREGNKFGTAFADKMEDILELLKTNLNAARASQEEFANANRQPAPSYRVGDQVFLDTRNITTSREMKKLDHKYIGPYTIEKVVNSHTYKLRLPWEHELLHDTFHTSLLRPSPTDPLPGQVNAPPPPVTIDANGEKLYAIDAILDSKREDGAFFYEILWRGHDPNDKTWEPLENVVNARASILEFERRYPKSLRPTKEEIKKARSGATKKTETRP